MNLTTVFRYNQMADAALNNLYESVGADSIAQKITVLDLKLGGSHEFYAFGGETSEEIRLGCLEYEFLNQEGLIELTLV